jgi:hypothetical protein
MGKNRFILLSIFASLIACGALSASASAYEFAVEGTAVTTPVDGTSTSGTSKLKGEILKTKIAVVSTSTKGQFLLEEKGKSKYTITFSGLSINEVNSKGEESALTECKVETITFSGTDVLVELSGEVVDEFKGSSPPLLTDIKIKGCALKGTYAVEGTADAILPGGGSESVLDLFEFNGTSQSLTLGGSSAEFTSGEELGLNNGKKWAAAIPVVVPMPNEFKFPNTMAGLNAGEGSKKTVFYENRGPGMWTFNGNVLYAKKAGAEDPFSFGQGAAKCVNVAVDATCEIIYEFLPEKKEQYLGVAHVEPNARPMTLEGKGM